MEIGSISNIIQNLSSNSKNVSGEKKNNTAFEEIIKNEKNTNKVVEKSNATVKKDKISEKLEEVSETAENGTDEEVLEAVMSLLQLLNIKIEDNTALPIKVDLSNVDLSNTDLSNIDLSNVHIELSDNSFLMENFVSNVDELLSLIEDVDGNNITKNQIFEVISNEIIKEVFAKLY